MKIKIRPVYYIKPKVQDIYNARIYEKSEHKRTDAT